MKLNPEQQAAVDARGLVFVSAGAGTGKTTVLVERFVRAVCDEGLDVESVLVITYTRKAAAELRGRIRTALRDRGRDDLGLVGGQLGQPRLEGRPLGRPGGVGQDGHVGGCRYLGDGVHGEDLDSGRQDSGDQERVTRERRKKRTFAGRSARRRMK